MCYAAPPPKTPPASAPPGSLANPFGFDFTGMSDYEFQQARNVSGDQLNYMTVEAQARRAEAIQKEIDRRDAPRRLAEERQALIAQQQAEMVAYERQMAEQQAKQEQQAAGLQAQQNERLAGIRARGSAVAQSLQVLGQQGSQAPTAQMTKRSTPQQGARTTSASLRMGSTSTGAGSGANISV